MSRQERRREREQRRLKRAEARLKPDTLSQDELVTLVDEMVIRKSKFETVAAALKWVIVPGIVLTGLSMLINTVYGHESVVAVRSSGWYLMRSSASGQIELGGIWLYSLLGAMFTRGVIRRAIRNQTVLTRFLDRYHLRSVPAFIHALGLRDSAIHKEASEALAWLLPKMNQEECKALKPDAVELLRKVFATATLEFQRGIFTVWLYRGGGPELNLVEWWIVGRQGEKSDLMALAERCQSALKARIEYDTLHANLLRPANPTEESLLRPAGFEAGDDQLLLRPSSAEPTGAVPGFEHQPQENPAFAWSHTDGA